jgi:hypothetical protein
MKKLEIKDYLETEPAAQNCDLPGMIQGNIGAILSFGGDAASSLAFPPDLKIKSVANVSDWKQGISYPISKTEVDACDVSRLLHDLRPEADNPIFTSGPGRLTFTFEGFEDRSDWLMVPELRDFIVKAHQAGLCWLYFANPESKWLLSVLAITGRQCSIIDHGNGLTQFSMDQGDRFAFLAYQIKAYRMLCQWAGIDSVIANAHSNQSIKHFFDGVLPPYLASL